MNHTAVASCVTVDAAWRQTPYTRQILSPCPAPRNHAHTCSVGLHTTAPQSGHTCNRASIRCAAGARAQPEAFDLPNSLEESVEQATQAILAQLAPKQRSKKKKGFKPVIRRMLGVEIPVADVSSTSQVELAWNVARSLTKLDDEVIVVFCDEAAADLASEAPSSSRPRCESCFLGDAFDVELEGTLLIVAPAAAQVETLLEGWRGTGAVALNPLWSTEELPEAHRHLVDAFDMVYCFIPLAIQGFFKTTEGAVFRWVRDSEASITPWAILQSVDGRWVQIGRQQRRPLADELELALYNAAAADSALTQGAKALRGLADKVQRGPLR